MPSWSEIIDELNSDQRHEMLRRERIEHGQQVLLGQLIRAATLLQADARGDTCLSDGDLDDISAALALAEQANQYGSEFFEFHGSRN